MAAAGGVSGEIGDVGFLVKFGWFWWWNGVQKWHRV
jgi:hypothetical protein